MDPDVYFDFLREQSVYCKHFTEKILSEEVISTTLKITMAFIKLIISLNKVDRAVNS